MRAMELRALVPASAAPGIAEQASFLYDRRREP
jgi:hypothetical protein